MKRILFSLIAMMAIGTFAKAQNLQVHYDFGKDRKMVTTTLEMFKPDKYGSTFFFVDMDYSNDSRGVDNGVSLAYWEIARSFKWKETQKFEPRVEFNSGNVTGFAIKNAWLAGGQYTFASSDFSKIFTLQANLKYIKDGKEDGDNLTGFQLTGVWAVQLMEGKLTFNGFADFWREDVAVLDDNGDFAGIKEYVFLMEPQLWYNVNQKLSLGGEIEISNNFGLNDGIMVNPTLAAKWTF
ncbi:DUF5020 family protein [Carboxylicivirga sp. M1479]|uniref:DUF5020 family protein n=1 Tax=Carboxylicivirga sp. M1479 TaxID=2594476 RepID=UPI0011783BD6|nr:DUF5020 family protein [Carboxylicivirga sp. M1479]TRX71984.1 DUF5020 family protein [Carboxylicivirga sp. M1479]